ncbi:MAG: hypothetical protein LBC86_08800 [Oscillospiraceae bacterium]|jgi:hypothetical protein|nr:hypothetical protein [Oscillospiraceae bacterium]
MRELYERDCYEVIGLNKIQKLEMKPLLCQVCNPYTGQTFMLWEVLNKYWESLRPQLHNTFSKFDDCTHCFAQQISCIAEGSVGEMSQIKKIACYTRETNSNYLSLDIETVFMLEVNADEYNKYCYASGFSNAVIPTYCEKCNQQSSRCLCAT